MVQECEICGATFKTVTNLNQHKKHAKYCKSKAESLKCKYCNQVAVDPNHLEDCIYYKNYKLKIELDEITVELVETKSRHETKLVGMKAHYESELAELQQKCTDLEQKLSKEQKFKNTLLVKKVSTPTNNTRINYNNVSVTMFPPLEEVKRQWETIICRDVLMGGIKEFARVGHQHFLMQEGKSTIVCVDPSRNKFTYVDSNQLVQVDMRLQCVTHRIFSPGADVAREFIRNLTVEDDEDEKLFNRGMPVGYIANINSPSNKEFIRHLRHHIQLADPLVT